MEEEEREAEAAREGREYAEAVMADGVELQRAHEVARHARRAVPQHEPHQPALPPERQCVATPWHRTRGGREDAADAVRA